MKLTGHLFGSLSTHHGSIWQKCVLRKYCGAMDSKFYLASFFGSLERKPMFTFIAAVIKIPIPLHQFRHKLWKQPHLEHPSNFWMRNPSIALASACLDPVRVGGSDPFSDKGVGHSPADANVPTDDQSRLPSRLWVGCGPQSARLPMGSQGSNTMGSVSKMAAFPPRYFLCTTAW